MTIKKICKKLLINNVVFKNVLLFIYDDGHFEVVDSWSGKTIAIVKKDDVKTLIVS